MTHSERSRLGSIKAQAQRRAEKIEGMAFARAWRAKHHPVPAYGHMPFHGHRTQAEVAASAPQQELAA